MNKIKKICSILVSKKRSKLRKSFDIFCMSVIIFDVSLAPLETFEYFFKYADAFQIIMWIITIIFTVEYFVRLIGYDRKWEFITSFHGVVDLLAVLPIYLTGGSFEVSHIRIVRCFRLLKLTKYTHAVEKTARALRATKDELLVLLLFSFCVIYVFSVFIYVFEHQVQPDQIRNIFDAVWLALVAMTTLGYGDLIPITALGKISVALFTIISIILITAPSVIFISAFLDEGRKEDSQNKV